MKFVILLVAIAVGWFVYQKVTSKPEVKQAMQDMKTGNTEPVRYVNALQNDVKKAEANAAKASAAVVNTNQSVEAAVKEGEGGQ